MKDPCPINEIHKLADEIQGKGAPRPSRAPRMSDRAHGLPLWVRVAMVLIPILATAATQILNAID